MVYDGQFFELDFLCEVVDSLEIHGLVEYLLLGVEDYDQEFMLGRNKRTIIELAQLRRIVQEGDKFDLNDFLFRHLQRHATDPRDQVYALLGLNKAAGSDEIKPDYNIDVAETYLRTCKYVVAREVQADFLHEVGLPRRIENLPSWVPDWSISKSTNRLVQRGVQVPGAVGFRAFCAGGRLNASWRIAEDLPILTGSGCFIDSLDELGSVGLSWRYSTQSDIAKEVHCLSESERMVQCSRAVMEGADAAEIHLRALLVDRPDHREGADPDVDQYKMMIRTILDPAALERECSTEQINDIGYTLARLFAMATGMRFCLTAAGNVGQVPSEAQSGDQICIFAGMKTPFVVRKRLGEGDFYFLVGECYIDGLMYGEALECADFRLQDISLV